MFRLLYVDPDAAGQQAPARGQKPDLAIGFAHSVDEALAQARQSDVVLVSATLPDNGALEIVRAVAQAEPHVRILVKDLAASHQSAAPFIEAGAVGWLL